MPLIPNPPRLREGVLLAKLREVQQTYGFLSHETLDRAAQDLGVPLTQLYSAATFYTTFSFRPRGRHTVRVCMGTACHIRGSEKLLEKLEADLEINPLETTSDGVFTLETVHCVGSCSMSPVIQIDNDTQGRFKINRLSRILKAYASKEDA